MFHALAVESGDYVYRNNHVCGPTAWRHSTDASRATVRVIRAGGEELMIARPVLRVSPTALLPGLSKVG